MAGHGGDGSRSKRAAEEGRKNPPKRQKAGVVPPPPTSDMRPLLDRAKVAMGDRAAADRTKGQTAEERRSASSGVRNRDSSGDGRTNRRSQDSSSRSLLDPPEQGAKRSENTAIPPSRGERAGDQVAAKRGEPLPAKDPVPSRVEPARAEGSSAPDKAKTVEAGGDHPKAGKGGAAAAKGKLLPFQYSGPDTLSTDKVACGELVYSIRGLDASYPDLENLTEKGMYERFARANVRSLMFANEVVASYDIKLAEAREEAEKARSAAEKAKEEAEEARREAEKAREEPDRLRARLENLRAFNERMNNQRQEEAIQERAEIARLRAQTERLKDRLRYLEAVEEPSGLVTQVRGTLGVVEVLRGKGIDIPKYMTDVMEQDLEKYKGQVREIPEVKLDDEDLL